MVQPQLQLPRDAGLPIGANQQAKRRGVDIDTQADTRPGGRGCAPAHIAARRQHAAIVRSLAAGGAQIAALAGDAGAAGRTTAQGEFGQFEAIAAQRRTQPAITQVDALDQRLDRHAVGAQTAAPLGYGTTPAQRGIGFERPLYPPARWRQHRPDTDVRQPCPHLAGQRSVVGPLPAAVALVDARTGFRLDLAGAFAVPGELGAHGIALRIQDKLGLTQARRGGRSGSATVDRAFRRGPGAVRPDPRHRRGLARLHPQVAAAACQSRLGAQGVAGIDVPVAVEDEIAADAHGADGAHAVGSVGCAGRRFAGNGAQRTRPCHGQAGQLALRAQAVARVVGFPGGRAL